MLTGMILVCADFKRGSVSAVLLCRALRLRVRSKSFDCNHIEKTKIVFLLVKPVNPDYSDLRTNRNKKF